MILGLFTISGHSMSPYFSPGDKVLISALPYKFRFPKINDIVVFRYSEKALVKRIERIEGEEIFVSGDNKSDTLEVGPIQKKDIIGKVIIKFNG